MSAHEDGDVDLDRDRALVLRCQEGDGAAFAELYTQYHDRLHRFCVRRLLDRDEADEVTQEAFLRAWRALPTFAGGLRFYPWLTVIAKNLCTDALRRRARCGTLQDFDSQAMSDATRPDPFSTAMSSEDTVMASFDGALAAQAMRRLSERHRHVLTLREQAGLSYQEIATAEGVEVSTVETLLWRARQALKREYAALSGTRVFGGLLVAGSALRRLNERLARRMSRLAMTGGIRVRDLAAAGVVTVALVSVSGAPGISANSSPASSPILGSALTTSPGPTRSASSASPTPTPPVSPAVTPPVASTTSSQAIAPVPASGGPPVVTSAPGAVPVRSDGTGSSAPVAPSDGSAVPPVVQTLGQVVSQIPGIVSNLTTAVGQVTAGVGNAIGSLPALPLTPAPLVPTVLSAASSLLGEP